MFMTPLRAEFSKGDMSAKLLDVLKYNDKKHGIIVVPIGFETDFASVKGWILLPGLVPRVGILREAAVVHDWLYQTGAKGMSRKDADKIFRRAMQDLGVYWWRVRLAYRAVRIGGRSSWKGEK